MFALPVVRNCPPSRLGCRYSKDRNNVIRWLRLNTLVQPSPSSMVHATAIQPAA